VSEYSALLVCSGGGHLKQLSLLAPRMGIDIDRALWVTFETGLSASLLRDREVVFATYAAPRDLRNIAKNQALARRLISEHRFSMVASTGASLAVNFLPFAARKGTPAHYVESAARAEGPSMTGRILRWAPRVQTYTQYHSWASAAWPFAGSVFDGFSSVAGAQPEVAPKLDSAVVTVGTTESYGFRRFIEKASWLLRDVPTVLWQTGVTPLDGLPIDGRVSVPARELEAAIQEADVVLTHAGTGIALTCLEAGKIPILVPRRKESGEHVDDHQLQIAAELAARGLAVACDADRLTPDVIQSALARRVRLEPSPLRLQLRAT
jgi:UDP-N-acetylglucosamine--N-acetylmuramyl-(pentapeptide) pyrophosphoryl-undecaprenol N-acetylglucosamine transferase